MYAYNIIADPTIAVDSIVTRILPCIKEPFPRVQCINHVKEKASVAVAAAPERVKGPSCGASSVSCIAATVGLRERVSCKGGGSLCRNLRGTVGLPRGANDGLDKSESASPSWLDVHRVSSPPSPMVTCQIDMKKRNRYNSIAQLYLILIIIITSLVHTFKTTTAHPYSVDGEGRVPCNWEILLIVAMIGEIIVAVRTSFPVRKSRLLCSAQLVASYFCCGFTASFFLYKSLMDIKSQFQALENLGNGEIAGAVLFALQLY
ncbi:hypothetical protein SS1G_07547 [Sclerotinia sclerotiorum 1980 UF-70]|uniref:Uncharacterized protein n=1 Tax=Sclerotinia sclerotiorum (strain ATCC 18683 / 1980 / Ss-1) TaxID=665079 RepID=A7EQE5_SCLS1|nr:hypothetical protein SS1G_07547 [Sclerotinia sclerotiorum 1980 UF-70]EDN91687.1 hypothetical protein SS1G_07547 [Sclerotinia sclerotiorum 1980 UF-70]